MVLEPFTEGRLAGWLARNGEGEAAIYVEVTDERAIEPSGAGREAASRSRMTALGRPGRIAAAEPGATSASELTVVVEPAG
jgi:hypothetical protein